MAGESILVVDDDEVLRSRMARALQSRGFTVYAAAGFDQAVEVVRATPIRWAVIDQRMPGRTGIELLRQFQDISPQTQTVMLTGYGSIAHAVEAMREGAVNYVTKPADAEEILAAFGMAERDEEDDDSIGYRPPSLAEAEWNHIHQVLSDCDGNISRAARLLDIPRRTLQRKLKKLAP